MTEIQNNTLKLIFCLLLAMSGTRTYAQTAPYLGGNGKGDAFSRLEDVNMSGGLLSSLMYIGGNGKGDAFSRLEDVNMNGGLLSSLMYIGGNGKGDAFSRLEDVNMSGWLLSSLMYIGGNGKGDAFSRLEDVNMNGGLLSSLMYIGGNGKGEARNVKEITAVGGQIFWRGGATNATTDWNTGSNWFPDQVVPNSTTPIWFEANGNGNNLVLNQNQTIHSLNFNGANKNLVLGNFNLTVSETIEGNDANDYIQTTGTGQLIKSIATGTNFTFPVGNSTYNPVSITNNTGTAEVFSVRVADAVLLGGSTGNALTTPRVNRTWHIDKTNPTVNAGSGVVFSFSWNPAQETGGISTYSLNHYNGTSWVFANATGGTQSVSGTNPKTLTFTGYKGRFSPFAIGHSYWPLPVTWLSFTGRPAGQEVQLEWKTASEQNSSHFEVERSQNGTDFTNIGRVAAAGNSQAIGDYQFYDRRPLGGTSYYRLRQVDLDGRYSYSRVIQINTTVQSLAWISPNPTKGLVSIKIPGDWTGVYECRVHGLTGNLLEARTGFTPGRQELDLGNLPKGMYILSLWQQGRQVHQWRVVRQ